MWLEYLWLNLKSEKADTSPDEVNKLLITLLPRSLRIL